MYSEEILLMCFQALPCKDLVIYHFYIFRCNDFYL